MWRYQSNCVQFLLTVLLIASSLSLLSGCTGEQLANAAVCGNGVVQDDEECDNGPSNAETGECTPDCILNVCGDGLLLGGVELCDEGNLNSDVNPDACRANCVLAHCGDNVIDTDEECDAGDANSSTEPDTCRLTCSAPKTQQFTKPQVLIAPKTIQHWGPTFRKMLKVEMHNFVKGAAKFSSTGINSKPLCLPEISTASAVAQSALLHKHY